jgi:DNA end-binding protein Ku
MPRALWKGAINFGLISIPVKMYKAASSRDIHFRELHDADGAPLRQKRICSVDGKEVSSDHVVKGYEISHDRFVVLKPEELEALEQKLPHSIDIENFASLNEIDPIFYKQSYYLVPDRGSNKAYSLLLTAMRETNKAAVARLTLRMREHIAVFRAVGNALALSTLFFADEVVGRETLSELPDDVKADKRELQVAIQIIDSLTAEFEPEKYTNVHKEKILELIERKAEGEDIEAAPVSKQPATVVDLMAALQASLAVSGGKRKEETKSRKEAAAKPGRKMDSHKRKAA